MKNWLSEMDWENWIRGLFTAVVTGGANAVIAGLGMNGIDPVHFNAQSSGFYKVVIPMFAFSATVSFFLYLKQNPLPQRLVSKTTATLTVEKTVEAKPAENPESKKQDGAA